MRLCGTRIYYDSWRYICLTVCNYFTIYNNVHNKDFVYIKFLSILNIIRLSSRETYKRKCYARQGYSWYNSYCSQLIWCWFGFSCSGLSIPNKFQMYLHSLSSIAPFISISIWPDVDDDDVVHTQHSSINPSWLLSVCVYTQIAVCVRVCVWGSSIYLDTHIVLHLWGNWAWFDWANVLLCSALVWSGSSYQRQPGNVWQNRKQCQALPGATEQIEERKARG